MTISLWHRVPVLVRAVLLGLLVTAAATYPWVWLVTANLHHAPGVPWAAAAMGAYLWLYRRYATGRGWPASTASARRANARIRPLSGDVWSAAILAGMLGLATAIVLIGLIGRLVAVPQERLADTATIPPLTLLATAVVGAAVAGIAEELGFRGYMQRPIEQRHGPVVAIVVVGLAFGFAHAGHTEWSLVLMPYYMAVAAVYGGLAWLSDSILPSLALHAGGDLLGTLQYLATNHSIESPATVTPTGVNAAFFGVLGILLALGTAAVMAYRLLAVAVRKAPR